ncbi:hypothetical protein JOE31_003554 [Arthrobacter sp. PvP023]|uniref:hypothetical protein n=1 Tax=Micrococcaceae TaxID=1268 RepID=UPI001AE8D4CE|nr:hypothetical protein [Arthrobacter sp. PvP023]MBP1137322.1 hypothetical protein [Arthrobacter sp. PvP023]
MPTREFESEIAVRIALLEPSDIYKLGELEKLANFVAGNAAERVPKSLAHLLASQLAGFMCESLGLDPATEYLPVERDSACGYQEVRSADAAVVVHRLLALTGSSALTDVRVRHELFEQLKLLLARFGQVVRSVHTARELSEYGWQWTDFNAGWESGLRNSEYELPMVWRALRSHDEDWLPPSDPAGSGVHADFITYWFSLSAVVLGHLAWANPARGMARWINSGMPGDDGILAGLKRLYGADAAALILNAQVTDVANKITVRTVDGGGEIMGTFDPSQFLLERPDIHIAVDANRRWRAMSLEGSDSLHLSVHLQRLLLGPSRHPVRLAGGHDLTTTNHTQFLLADGYGWYEILQQNGDLLPNRPIRRSWRVDVTSATLGYIGEFRKSRETGRWFAGKHSSHMLGN